MNEEEWMTEGFSRKTQGRGALGVRGKRTLLERVQGVSDALSLWSPSDLTQDQLNCLCWTRWSGQQQASSSPTGQLDVEKEDKVDIQLTVTEPELLQIDSEEQRRAMEDLKKDEEKVLMTYTQYLRSLNSCFSLTIFINKYQ
ncbi:uncharacterized protein AB9X84_002874 isoform 1-T1 [Acanthopagrus schlegelii]